MFDIKSTFLGLVILIAVCHVESDLLGKIKDGFNAAYDEVHCGFHKVKEFVKHHEHEVDPCSPESKSTTSSTLPNYEASGQTQNYYETTTARAKPENSYGWTV
ncbi:hypothetical protein JTB14_028450 [Gonioctena quinquepunctata]|nr:hypothetical protein JTB14_028450 [Gonioctena quinquepunctata]